MAKWVGDLFNDGLYNHHIELKKTPFLGWESPEQTDALIAADVMNSTNLCYIFPISRVRWVEKLLRNMTHSAFLVVTPVDSKRIPRRRRSISDSYIHIQLSRIEHSGGKLQSHSLVKVANNNILHPLFYLSGEHQTAANRDLNELTATIQDLETKPKSSHTLPQHTCKRGRRSNAATPTHFIHTYEGPDNLDTEGEERDTSNKDVLTFHGLILRSQLTEMFKNKIFFNESEGVSRKRYNPS